MIDLAQEDGVKSFENFMKYKNLENIYYKRLARFEGKFFVPKTKTGRSYVLKISTDTLLKAMLDEAEYRGCESFEEFMDLKNTDAVLNRISSQENN